MGAYYNTTHLTGDQLRAEILNADKQETAVLAVFRHARVMSPSQVHRKLLAAGMRWPLTSIRRAINTLTEAEVLGKTTLQTPGAYGKPEHLWTIAKPDVHSSP